MWGEVSAKLKDARFAALVFDLHSAGVACELADEPYDWFGSGVAPAPAKVVAPGGVSVAPIMARKAPPLEIPTEKSGVTGRLEGRLMDEGKAPAALVPVPVEVENIRVWTEGEPGGVVVLLGGEEVPSGAERELLGRMLVAVGLDDAAPGWVGVAGLPEFGGIARRREEIAAEVAHAIGAMRPARVLVLGQAVLAALLGRSLGVEGWHVAPVPLPGAGEAVAGVTYPPALLLVQPLFKRLAWQHLLRWQQGGKC